MQRTLNMEVKVKEVDNFGQKEENKDSLNDSNNKEVYIINIINLSESKNLEESKNEKKLNEKSVENGESDTEKAAGNGCPCPCLII